MLDPTEIAKANSLHQKSKTAQDGGRIGERARLSLEESNPEKSDVQGELSAVGPGSQRLK